LQREKEDVKFGGTGNAGKGEKLMFFTLNDKYKFLLAGIFLFSMVGCKGDDGEKSAAPEEEKEKKAPLVKVLTVGAADFIKKVEFVGSCRAKTVVMVSSEEPGLVKRTYFDKGEKVKKGAILIGLDDALLKASLKELEASYEIERLNHEKLLALKKGRGAVTDFDLRNALLKTDMAGARVENLKAQLKKKKIFSPIEGVVEVKHVEEGEYVTPGKAVATLADLSTVKVEVAIAEKDLSYFTVGTVAEVVFNAYGGEVFKGTIDYISPQVERKAGTFLVEITLKNDKNRFKPGMMARVKLVKERCEDCLLVPQDAILDDVKGRSLFIVTKEGVAERRPVLLGEMENERIVVISGVSEGERVVVVGQRNLLPGEKVSIVQ